MAHPDLDQLVNFCLPFAQNQLKKRGAFLPFAATVGSDGAINPLAVLPDDEQPDSQHLIDLQTDLITKLVAEGQVQATAICWDGSLSVDGPDGTKQDAVTVALEHSGGESILVFLPYRKRFLLGYGYDELIAHPGEKKFFP